MNAHRAALRAAVDAVEILSPTAHSWLGIPAPALPAQLAADLDAETARGYLVHRLGLDLYTGFYCTGHPAPLPRLPDDVSIASPELVHALAAANGGGGCWEPGWRVLALDGGELWVARGELRFRARSGQVRADEGTLLAPGVMAHVLHPKELLRRSPGFYMALADVALAEDEPVVRLYWNLEAEGVVAFVAAATRALNRDAVPARLKVVTHPASCSYRCDAGVLYVPRRAFPALRPLVVGLHERLRGRLGRATPALTKRLAHGLGLAEDAESGESFGLHRCALIAEGLVRAHDLGAQTTAARAEQVEACLVEHGVDPAAPYLAPGSADVYTALEAADAPMDDVARADRDERWLETAEQIGGQIADAAIWHEGRCNWIGADVIGQDAAGRPLACHRALDAALYSGTVGVAVFLAQLYLATGDRTARDVAVGAFRQAVAAAGREVSPGLFTGASGVALSVLRAAELLDAPGIGADALALADAALAASPSEHDLLVGAAGEAIAFLRLASLTGRPRYADAAIRLGDGLLTAAQPEEMGWSWPSSAQSGSPNLTGFSHGAAGVAYALLALHEATEADGYRAGAEAAFAYERAHYDAGRRNWPDFRELGESGSPAFPVLWCHGAPGIALSRLAGWRLLGDERCREEARAALVTTRAALRRDLEHPGGSFCLCHGTAGNADILLEGAALLGEEDGSGRALAAEAARMGQECHRARGSWPCGVPAGQTPSLMLGLAGIGQFFLRLHDPAVPTPLAP